MTITAKYTPTTAQARTEQRYQRPPILTWAQAFMVILITSVSCAIVDWYGLLAGVAMVILLATSNANLRMMIADIEQEELEEGHR